MGEKTADRLRTVEKGLNILTEHFTGQEY